jgi:hypothetical protein
MPRLEGRKEDIMEISNIDLIQSLYGTYETAFQPSSSISDDGSWAVGNRPSEKMDISKIGKFRNTVSQLSNEEKEALSYLTAAVRLRPRQGTPILPV